jgi:hypothetical protein
MLDNQSKFLSAYAIATSLGIIGLSLCPDLVLWENQLIGGLVFVLGIAAVFPVFYATKLRIFRGLLVLPIMACIVFLYFAGSFSFYGARGYNEMTVALVNLLFLSSLITFFIAFVGSLKMAGPRKERSFWAILVLEIPILFFAARFFVGGGVLPSIIEFGTTPIIIICGLVYILRYKKTSWGIPWATASIAIWTLSFGGLLPVWTFRNFLPASGWVGTAILLIGTLGGKEKIQKAPDIVLPPLNQIQPQSHQASSNNTS